eukprot:TRINITY_DN61503_c0_g1_i1.p1 TRINITY_DN61503_c0_g1~~TRINITY_DN61503_c0_g1_i1.p1  ORF type:complete len:149 (+),score=46.55 TRINITY_DN61503_c0_g1_i1:131-577(+)
MLRSLVGSEMCIRDSLPTAYEVQRSFRSAAVLMAPPPFDEETGRLFDEMAGTLGSIFGHYTKIVAVRSKGSPELTLKELSRLAEDLGIVPKLLSFSEVTQLGKACLQLSNDVEALSYEMWLDWLYRAATHGFSKPPFGRLYILSLIHI